MPRVDPARDRMPCVEPAVYALLKEEPTRWFTVAELVWLCAVPATHLQVAAALRWLRKRHAAQDTFGGRGMGRKDVYWCWRPGDLRRYEVYWRALEIHPRSNARKVVRLRAMHVRRPNGSHRPLVLVRRPGLIGPIRPY